MQKKILLEKKPRHFFYTIENPYPPTTVTVYQLVLKKVTCDCSDKASSKTLKTFLSFVYQSFTLKNFMLSPIQKLTNGRPEVVHASVVQPAALNRKIIPSTYILKQRKKHTVYFQIYKPRQKMLLGVARKRWIL